MIDVLLPKWRFYSFVIIPSLRFEEVIMVFENMFTQSKQAHKVGTRKNASPSSELSAFEKCDLTKEGHHRR